jgi:hypothetical protein
MTDKQETNHAFARSRLNDGLAAANGRPFSDWFDDKTAEYRMQGYKLTEAKERAMSDWHTYEAANVIQTHERI